MSNFAKPLVKQRVQSIRSDALIFDMELILRKEIARNNGCARRAIFFSRGFLSRREILNHFNGLY